MTQIPHILHACTIDGNGGGAPIPPERISAIIKSEELAWVHLDSNSPQTREWLSREITYLDHIIIDALLVEDPRPRALDFENGSLLILRGVNLNQDAEPEDMVSVRLWIDEERIISVQRRPLKAIRDIHERLMAKNGPKDSGDFIASLVARLFERMEPVFSDLDNRLDDIEENVLLKPDADDRKAITSLRQSAILFRRYIAPQRDVISHLRASEQNWIDPMQKRRLQEALNQITRYIEDLDTIRERAQVMKDELASILSDRMTKNLYVLSIISAIFLPLGFLTGLLGINVGGIPGSENQNSFYIFCGILSVVVLLQMVLFKKMKWF